MADQVQEGNMNNTLLLEHGVSVKEEECQDQDLSDEVYISETAITATIDNAELQDHLKYDKMAEYDVSTTLDNTKTEMSLSEVHDNLKVEWIRADEIKSEFIDRLLYCENCQAYREDYCIDCEMLVHILNRIFPINRDDRSQKSLLPDNILEIQDYSGEFHVFALKVIPVGVRFGPFTGLNRTEHPWRIKGGKFVVNKDKLRYLNWMQYVNPARSISKQNLLVFQYEDHLYYETTHQIEEGDELLVHFGDQYEDSINGNAERDFVPTTDHIFKDAFACTYCCLGFSSKLYLAKHKTICSGNSTRGFSIEELTQCPSCKIYLDSKEYITQHMNYCCERNDSKGIPPVNSAVPVQIIGSKTRPRPIYECRQCKYRTKYKGDLKNHSNQHYEMKKCKCAVCCRRFRTTEVLRLHVKNTHICRDEKEDLQCSRSQDEIKKSKCSLCEFRTKHKHSLKRHMAVKHFKAFNYKCDGCDYKTSDRFYLKIHIEARHLKEFKHACETCDYKTNRKDTLKKHIKSRHLREFKHKCDACDYKTNDKSRLKTHIEARHLRIFKYKCDMCDYETNLKSYLKRHIKTKHLKEYNRIEYKCDKCKYKANLKSELKRHTERRHFEEFKYKCDRCDFKTNYNSCLKKHIESRHLKVFKHKCDTCDYKTNYKSRLKTHIQGRHLRIFKYKCDTCDYETNWECDLKKHIERRHFKEFKYKCDTCDFKTNYKSTFKNHIKAMH